MSMDPALLAQILSQQGGQQQQQGPMAAQQQPLGTAADLTRKIMMMQMQRPPQSPGVPIQPPQNPAQGMPPITNPQQPMNSNLFAGAKLSSW